MARIPERTFVAPRDSGAQPPQGAFNASIRASKELIESVGGVADAFVKEGIKAQEIANDTQKREEIRGQRDFKAQFDRDMMGDPENGIVATPVSQWGTEWQKRLKGYKNSMDGREMPPVVKRFVDERLISVHRTEGHLNLIYVFILFELFRDARDFFRQLFELRGGDVFQLFFGAGKFRTR